MFMTILLRSAPSILPSTLGIRNPETLYSKQDTLWSGSSLANVEQRRPDYAFKLQLEHSQVKFQEKLIENDRDYLLYGGIVSERQQSELTVRSFPQSESGKVHRLNGSIQFILSLLDCWNLKRKEAINLLGFEETEYEFVIKVLEGNELLRGRDAKDRLSHLFCIRKSLHDFFQDLKSENEWLRELQPLLDGRTPMDLLLGGSMEDILLVREYVDHVVGR